MVQNYFQGVTLAQEDACGNLQVIVSELRQNVMQPLLVARETVFI